jgi:hypothetical protein
MSYTREQGVRQYLVGLGNLNPDQRVVYWACGWSAHEIDPAVCEPDFNLFGCGEPVAGSHRSHCVTAGSVQDYDSMASAVLAWTINLALPMYTALRMALQANDIATLSQSPDIIAALARWTGNSNGYAQEISGFEMLGQQHAQDMFIGGSSGGGTTTDIITASAPCPPCDPGDQLPAGATCCDPQWCNKLGGSQKTACLKCQSITSTLCAPGDAECQQKGQIFCEECVYSCYQDHTGYSSVDDCINACYQAAGGQGNATPGLPNPSSILPDWLLHPDWLRVLKVVAGGVLIAYGLKLMIDTVERPKII